MDETETKSLEWHVLTNDLIGGYAIVTFDKTHQTSTLMSDFNPKTDGRVIADFISFDDARWVADAYNLALRRPN